MQLKEQQPCCQYIGKLYIEDFQMVVNMVNVTKMVTVEILQGNVGEHIISWTNVGQNNVMSILLLL